ncbi:unnamed protein product [Prunus armeniaca]|uniref:Uncharacterized protein n=1 Tax=Prunus armeniaca TaxID=36596 RepID=A0A6J5UEF4_PRUAR|nr:unnamed protein product [Prunus armeniaca]
MFNASCTIVENLIKDGATNSIRGGSDWYIQSDDILRQRSRFRDDRVLEGGGWGQGWFQIRGAMSLGKGKVGCLQTVVVRWSGLFACGGCEVVCIVYRRWL